MYLHDYHLHCWEVFYFTCSLFTRTYTQTWITFINISVPFSISWYQLMVDTRQDMSTCNQGYFYSIKVTTTQYAPVDGRHHRVYKVRESPCRSSELAPPTLSTASECVPPGSKWGGGGTHTCLWEVGGRSQFMRRDRHCGTLCTNPFTEVDTSRLHNMWRLIQLRTPGTLSICTMFGALKGLSHEMDFHNVDENWQILALLSAAAGFWIFRRPLWF